MAVTHTVNVSLSSGSGSVSSVSFAEAQEAERNFNAQLAASTANHALALAITTSKIKNLYVVADQDCTVYTNSTSGATPQETWTLYADIPVIWNASMPHVAIADIFAGDITNVYVTCGATSTNFKWYTCLDN